MKISRTLFLLFLVLFTSTAFISFQTKPTFTPTAIRGAWYLNAWTSYHTLIFNNSTVFVDNSADTVFTLKYSLSHDTLITQLRSSDQVFKNKILFLTSDSLILEGIHDSKGKIAYTRKKNCTK